MKLPLRVVRFRCSIHDEVAAYIIKDALDRGINIPCDPNPLRREVAKLYSPEEAEALAKRIARLLTDDAEKAAATPKDDGG